MAYAPPTRPSVSRVGRRGHPQVWALHLALLEARERLPYATAEARLLDGLDRWVRLESTSPSNGAPALAPVGPRWAACLAAVAAVARLVSPESAGLLAPWAALGAGLAPGAPGVSPHAADAAAFAPLGRVAS